MKIQKNDRSRLIAAAMGRIPCDLTVKNIRLVNVFTGEIYPAEVDILDGSIVRVRQAGEKPLLRAAAFMTAGETSLFPDLSTPMCI